MTQIRLLKAEAFEEHVAKVNDYGDLSGIDVMIPVNYPVPTGWWDTGDRLLSGESERAIISNWQPSSLFTNGEQGAVFDPSDLSTLWQDSARTTPVTADGDPVGCIDDKSGNGNHATQATASKRPLYKTSGGLHYLYFDGVDDLLVLSQKLNMNSGVAALRLVDQKITSGPVALISGGGAGYIGTLSLARNMVKNNAGDFETVDTPSTISLADDRSVVININSGFLTVYWDGGAGPFSNSVGSSSGLDNIDVLMAFNSSGGVPFQGKLFGAVLRETSLTETESVRLVRYLESM